MQSCEASLLRSDFNNVLYPSLLLIDNKVIKLKKGNVLQNNYCR